MKILVLTEFFFPDSVGGANKMAYHAAAGLAKRGHRVSVLTRRLNHRSPRLQTIDGMAIARCDLPGSPVGPAFLKSPLSVRQGIERLRRKAGAPFDLVIVHQPLIAMLGGCARELRGIPRVYNFHSSWGEEYDIRVGSLTCNGVTKLRRRMMRQMRDAIEKRVLSGARRIIVLSEFMKLRLVETHGPRGGIEIVPGGVNIDAFCPESEPGAARRELGLPEQVPMLLTVRNLRRRMGLGNLLEALAVVKANPAPLLVIVGAGELEGELKGRASDLGLGEQVVFAGRAPEERLPLYYQATDFFVLPTEQLEGFGMATAEALASGTPVIGTPVGATPELLGKIGKEWITRDSSAGALAETITERLRWMTDHPPAYRETCRTCREVAVRDYAWPRVIDRWEAVCREAVGC